jgi:triacylglycerol lipase
MNIVLAHGFLGFRQLAGVEYFNGVKQYLEANLPVKVLVTKVDPDDSIAVRGGQLRRQILAALGDLPPATKDEEAALNSLDPSQKTHLIGHSMGGLDGRFILSPGNPDHIASRIASLTTISTPHHGSPIADLIAAKLRGRRLWLWNWWIERKLRQIITGLGVSLDGLHDLTAGGAAAFNRTYIDHPQVHYFSVAGAGRANGRPTAKILYPAYKYIKEKTREDNDGLVGTGSAKWGEFDARLWPADHVDEVGHDFDHIGKPGRFDHLARFGEIVERLKQI